MRIKIILSRGNLCPSQKKLKTELVVEQSQLLTNERWVLQESNNSLQKCVHECGVLNTTLFVNWLQRVKAIHNLWINSATVQSFVATCMSTMPKIYYELQNYCFLVGLIHNLRGDRYDHGCPKIFRYLNPIPNRGGQILPTTAEVITKFSTWLLPWILLPFHVRLN